MSKLEGMIANLHLNNWQVSYQHNGNYKVVSSKYFHAYNKVSSLDNFSILQKEAILDLWSVQGFFQRNQR